MIRKAFYIGAMASALVLASTAANATVTLGDASSNSTPHENVLFGENESNTNTTHGTTNQSGAIVVFTSTDLLDEPSSGQARLDGFENGTFTNVSFAMEDPALGMSWVSFNVNIANPDGGQPETGTIDIVVDVVGESATSFLDQAVSSAGENRFWLLTSDNEIISRVTITSDSPLLIDDLRQVRIAVAGGEVPEPASISLLGLGLAALAMRRRRKVA